MSKDVVDKIAELVTTAFGLVAALAWNTAIQKWFEKQTMLSNGGPWLYAILVTIFAVVATIWIGRLAARTSAR